MAVPVTEQATTQIKTVREIIPHPLAATHQHTTSNNLALIRLQVRQGRTQAERGSVKGPCFAIFFQGGYSIHFQETKGPNSKERTRKKERKLLLSILNVDSIIIDFE